MITTAILSRDSSVDATDVPTGGRITLIIISISALVATILILALAYITYVLFRRRQTAAFTAFEAARLRNPTLTWEEHTRRRRFTRSRLLFEDELQRSTIIRKSLQGRKLVINGRTRGNDRGVSYIVVSAKGGKCRDDEFLMQTHEDEGSRNDEITPSGDAHELPNGDQGLLEAREAEPDVEQETPPTTRLKTPPPLIHPALRSGITPFPPRRSSLSTESTRMGPTPILNR
ncbi:hypothetical protein F4677DRAFT_419874 [Hypoxylon crocopeplum]|nr:hypothetical protein F4677DRAFT_419874 [Hypoxylon crocopeplum]